MSSKILAAAISISAATLLSSCSTPSGPVEPVPGSITYGGQPRTKLTKSPVGSKFQHRFAYGTGMAVETYVIEPDRSVKLIRRDIIPDLSLGNG